MDERFRATANQQMQVDGDMSRGLRGAVAAGGGKTRLGYENGPMTPQRAPLGVQLTGALDSQADLVRSIGESVMSLAQRLTGGLPNAASEKGPSREPGGAIESATLRIQSSNDILRFVLLNLQHIHAELG